MDTEYVIVLAERKELQLYNYPNLHVHTSFRRSGFLRVVINPCNMKLGVALDNREMPNKHSFQI